MQHTTVVSSRGQVTLPSTVRKALGIAPGDTLILEERDGEIVLRLAAVLGLETYRDNDIEAWQADDEMPVDERTALRAKLRD